MATEPAPDFYDENEDNDQENDEARQANTGIGFRGCMWWIILPSMVILFLVLPLLNISPLYALLPLLIPIGALGAVIVVILIALLSGKAKLRIRRH